MYQAFYDARQSYRGRWQEVQGEMRAAVYSGKAKGDKRAGIVAKDFLALGGKRERERPSEKKKKEKKNKPE